MVPGTRLNPFAPTLSISLAAAATIAAFVRPARVPAFRFSLTFGLEVFFLGIVMMATMTLAMSRERGAQSSQVGLVRERFFTPRLRVKSYDELNAWLMGKCIAWAKAHPIPNSPTKRSGRSSRKSVPSSFPIAAAPSGSQTPGLTTGATPPAVHPRGPTGTPRATLRQPRGGRVATRGSPL